MSDFPTDPLRRMRQVNTGQARYYDQADGAHPSGANGLATNVWRRLRGRALGAIGPAQQDRILDRHRQWMGDLAGRKVLELGCGRGTRLSRWLAETAGEYHALDLSAQSIATLKRRLRKQLGRAGRARLVAGDFLDDGWQQGGFDLIYAKSVLHHFEFLDPVLERIEAKLAPGGQLVTLDPVATWAPMRLVRGLYRPFQTDRDWEFPFDHQALAQIESRFRTRDSLGIFGAAKWAMPLALLSPALGRRLGDRWFAADMERDWPPPALRRCLQVSYWLEKR